MATAVKKSL